MKLGDIEYEFAWTCPKCKCHVYEEENLSICDLGNLKICDNCRLVFD